MNKIKYHRWLYSPIKYSDDRMIDIIGLLYDHILQLISNYPNLEIINTYDMFNSLCIHVYNEYVIPYHPEQVINFDDKDYIELYCEQDVINIFSYFKHNFSLFPNNSNAYPLLLFIVNQCCVNEIDYDDYNDSDIDYDF